PPLSGSDPQRPHRTITGSCYRSAGTLPIELGRTLPRVAHAPRSRRALVLPMTPMVNADPLRSFDRDDWSPRVCETCGSTSLTTGRLAADGGDRVEMLVCDACGDFWFERAGVRMTADA